MVAALCACGGSGGSPSAPMMPPTRAPGVPLQISSDHFTDPVGQHDTEVEPSAAVHGATILAAFQVARQVVAGGSAIGVAVSNDGGSTWAAQPLPLVTRLTGGAADSASDAVVAYDASHAVWLVASLPIVAGRVPYPEVSRSSDGLQWDAPVPVSSGDVSDDKEWIACDDVPASPHYGSCYATWDDDGRQGLLESAVSRDGGVTWGVSRTSSNSATGIGAQAVPMPNGDVVIVSDDYNEASVLAYVSHDGGASFGPAQTISPVVDHFQGGDLRSGPLVSTAVDAAGTAYAVWQDCRFEPACAADDLVLATSRGGTAWTAPVRLPLDPVGSGVDHFIPGLGISPSGELGLTYYTYAKAACPGGCILSAALTASPDGGVSWSAPIADMAAMSTAWLPNTTEGVMVADYVATAFASGSPIGIFAQASPPSGGLFEQAIDAWRPSLPAALALRRVDRRERPVPNARSDHGPRRLRPFGN